MPDKTGSEPLHVFFIAAEAAPFAKVGGLADVAGSLPAALNGLSIDTPLSRTLDVRLVIPFHPQLRIIRADTHHLGRYFVPSMGKKGYFADIYSTTSGPVTVYLVDGSPIRSSSAVYHFNTWEDGDKFVFFSKAVLRLPKFLDIKADILHCNDWHTALTCYLLDQEKNKNSNLSTCRSILTIHNLPFMGGGIEGAFNNFNILPSSDPRLPGWSRSFPLPMGLSRADKIVAVSPTYADELLTPEFGCGLQDFLHSRQADLSGIINGIDVNEWDPSTDQSITSRFSAKSLERRKGNKLFLTQAFNLNPDPSIPLIGMVSRLDPQKGIDLIPSAFYSLIDRPWQAILLGSGDPEIDRRLHQMAQDLPNRVRFINRFDLALSHQIYAGCDMLLMPSRYEPCGLSQMIAMRYACLPIARATGGLVDTIQDPTNTSPGTGFLYQGNNSQDLTGAVQRALDVLVANPVQWSRMQINALQQDFSWNTSARQYAQLYSSLIQSS